MMNLLIVQGPQRGQTVRLLNSRFVIGRDKSCDLQIPVPMISRRHCAIIRENSQFYLEDLGSRNGTCINGQRITDRVLLNEGDLIEVDDSALRFVADDAGVRSLPVAEDSEQTVVAEEQTKFPTIVATLDVSQDLRTQKNATAKLDAILALHRRIGLSLDVEDVIKRVLESTLEIFPQADRVIINLSRDQDARIPYAICTRTGGFSDSQTIGPISQTIIQRVLDEGVAVLSSDVRADDRFQQSRSIFEMGINSVMCVPLVGPSKSPVGLLTVDTQELDRAFEESDLDVLVTVARMAAQSMDYAQLHNQLIAVREQSEEALRRTNQTLKTVIKASPLPLFLLEANGHQVRIWNRAAEDTFGWGKAEVLNQTVPIFPPEWHQRFLEHCGAVLNDRSFTGAEFKAKTKQGELRDIELSGAPLRGGTGKTWAILCMAADVTELKQARDQLLQRERLAAIGETMAGIAHESRNALHRIHMGLTIIASGTRDSEIAETVEQTLQAGQELQQLYDDLRSYAAPIQLDYTDCDLRELAESVWNSLQPEWQQRNVHVSMDFSSEVACCQADRHRLRQVIRNVLENALSACSDPVAIDISLADMPSNIPPAKHLVICDNGPGIDEEQLPRIFEPFFTTKSSGTGLGMAISKRIMEAHGGTISVVNRQPSGAKFTLVIPQKPEIKSLEVSG